ncbi:MAG: hypothetical protein V4568_12350 [Pseudomonadota bacterium]
MSAAVGVAKFSILNKKIGDQFYLERRSLTAFQLSLFYLAIPAFLFLFTFSKETFGYPIAAMIAVSLWFSVRVERHTDDLRLYLLALVPALGTAWLAGFPSGPFAWDWIKHWALINALADNDWPVVIPLDGAMAHLRFYIGAYLVPAALHKAVPALPVSVTTGIWFVIGYALVFRIVSVPLARRGRAACFSGMLALLLFAGADFFAENGYRLVEGWPIKDWFGIHYEMWFANATHAQMQYSSMLVGLLWVPHQSIATFIVAAMIVLNRNPRSIEQSLIAFGLLALWSPYGMIGLLPLMLVRFVREDTCWFQPRVIFAGVSAGAFALLVAFYLSTDIPKGGMCVAVTCIFEHVADFFDLMSFWFVDLSLFWIVELAVFGLILRTKMLADVMCLVSTLTLLLIPFFAGETADLVMRASMGPVFVLVVRSVETLATWRLQNKRIKTLWFLALVLSVPTAASEVIYQLENGQAHARTRQGDPLNQRWYRVFADSPQINAQQFFDICDWKYFSQYFIRRTPVGIRNKTEP